MAPSGEGASAAAPSSAYEGGGDGVGGKFRKRPFRKTHTTPYDRPPTALRNPSWLSKLVVDPASKLIASSAQRFFAPLFRKRLPPPPSPPPPPPPESNQDSSNRNPDAGLKAEAREAAVGDGENFTHSTDGGSISELEQLLKQKTFTRSEIDRLTELLHSRAVDLPLEDGVKRTEANASKLVANFERQRQQVISSEEKRNESYRSHGLDSTPGTSRRVLEDDIASPAEIAKAYMGNQVSKVSPSTLGLRSRAVMEDAAMRSNVPYTPTSAMISLSTKSTAHVEVPENGFTTPRSRGRSAIYNMARTPYARVHPTAFDKGSGSRSFVYGGPLLPTSSLKEPDGDLGSRKLDLKRRSSVLDEDLGSVGPMRRIRQKHNLLSHKLPLAHGFGSVSDAVKYPLSLNQKFPSKDDCKHEGPKGVGENDVNRTPRTSYVHVPPKSSEMAARILEHLEKMTPKEKSAESKLITAREKTPVRLTTDMLRGQALKSLEHTDSLKLLEGNEDGHKLEDWSQSNSLCVPAPAKEDRKEVNGSEKLDSQHDLPTPVENSHITVSVKGVLSSVETSDSVAKSVAQRPQKKRAFMMSAHEDSLELEDDINLRPASEPLPDWRENQETFATNKSSSSAEKLVPEKAAALPEIRTSPEPISGKRRDLEIGNAAVVGKEKTGVTIPNSIASGATSQLVTLPSSAKQAIHGVTTFQSSSSSVTEILGPKPFPWTNQKAEISISSDGTGTGVTDASVGTLGSGKANNVSPPEAAKSNGRMANAPAVALSSTSGGISSIIPISSNNGPLAINSSPFSFPPAPVSTGFASQFSNSTSSLASSPGTLGCAATASTSAASISSPVLLTSAPSSSSPVFWTTVPSSPLMPIFKSGASTEPSATSASGAETSVMNIKTEKEASSGSASNLLIGNSSFASVTAGNNVFGLTSTVVSVTASSQSQGSFPSTGMPNQFGSSASSSVLGTSGVTSFTSSNALSSSSTMATKLLSTGSGFGLSTSGSSAETKSVSTGSGATSSMFTSGINASSSSSVSNAINSNGGGAPAAFSFGASSFATSSSANASSSSSAAAPTFNFGSSNMVSSSSGGSSSIFGGSPFSSSFESSPASSSSAAASIFGSSWQASKSSSPFGSTFSSSPLTDFAFGAGSSPFGSSNSASIAFGASTGVSPGSAFSFSTASSTTTSLPSVFNAAPTFGNSSTTFIAPAGNNDQMNTEDSMAEDPVQSSVPALPSFGQQPISPSPGPFVFGSNVPSQTTPFQFGGQQSQAAQQSPSPFQASGSLEFNAGGGSFSLGSGGVGADKSGRKFVKVNKNRHRKK